MTDPRQTSRNSATSARTKTFRDRPSENETPWRITIESGERAPIVMPTHWRTSTIREAWPPPIEEPSAPPAPRRLITGHGIGWLIGVLVGLATLWAVFHGGHL